MDNLIPFLMFLAFSVWLFVLGRKLVGLTSYQERLMAYQMNPAQYGWFERRILAWKYNNQKFATWLLNTLGNKTLTLFYRFTGVLLIIVGVMFLGVGFLVAFEQPNKKTDQ